MIKLILLLLSTCIPYTFVWSNHSPSCEKSYANFDYELAQKPNSNRIVPGWGPKRTPLFLSPMLTQCMDDPTWQQKRILAAADYWIKQKLNYCHHYLPLYITPPNQRNKTAHQGGYCSQAKNIMSDSVYYKQQARWNYNGLGNETIDNWLNQDMWKGMDCSNYTTFLYNFALGQSISSNVAWQAGQRKGELQKNLSPNQQSGDNLLDNPQAAGKLVCTDNTLEVDHSCTGHGGYLSVIDQAGQKHKGIIKATDLARLPLSPGDLLFISATRSNSPNPGLVTHVVMWTGKQVGYGSNDIHPSLIAPNSLCPQEQWMPHLGDWVITDSHYQGADYRVITPCFYLNNLWGIRRVIK